MRNDLPRYVVERTVNVITLSIRVQLHTVVDVHDAHRIAVPREDGVQAVLKPGTPSLLANLTVWSSS